MNNIVKQAEEFICKYVTLSHEDHSLVLALWAIGTHMFWTIDEETEERKPMFDAFPYLVINKPVKRAGGTRCMEIVSFIASNSRTYSADSPSSMFRDIQEIHPAMFIDEAEKLNAENHPARELLNKGYKAGQTITRVQGGKSVEFDCYCPKCFVLIGDVYDTLRDRSIMITMRRRTPLETAKLPLFRMKDAKEEGASIRELIHSIGEAKLPELESHYSDPSLMRLDWLNDRDEEIWQALFALCHALAPERIDQLKHISADLAAEKQAPAKKESREEAELADFNENKILLLKDIVTVMNGHGKEVIPSGELLAMLKGIPTGQWRKFKGRGLNTIDIAQMLDDLSVKPKTVRISKKVPGRELPASAHWQRGSTRKGYKRTDLLAAAHTAGLI